MPTSFAQVRQMISAAQRRHARLPSLVRGARVPYYRRGELRIPALDAVAPGASLVDVRARSMTLLHAATTLPADYFFYDLDEIPAHEQRFLALARQTVIEALQTFDFSERIRAFRPHGFASEHFESDLIEIVGAVGDRIDVVVVGGLETADEIRDVQNVLRHIQRVAGRQSRIMMEVVVGSPRALLNAEPMAALEDVSSLVLDSWALVRALGGQLDPRTWTSDLGAARQMLPVMAATHGKDAVDGFTPSVPVRPKPDAEPAVIAQYQRSLDMARIDAENARRLGFAAKWILHPDQIEPIQATWTPSRQLALSTLRLAAELARNTGGVFTQNLPDRSAVATDWWHVRTALRAGTLSDEDIRKTGFTVPQLERFVRTDG